MRTGLQHEGEEARQRFVVYWLRPALAALAFGLFTFLVTAVPGEKEKIELRTQLQIAGKESSALVERVKRLDAQLRELVPFANALRADRLMLVSSSGYALDSKSPRARLAFDAASGQGILAVRGIEAPVDRRAFGWSLENGRRHPLAAIDLTAGAGSAEVRLADGASGGTIEITLSPLDGEPDAAAAELVTLSW